MKKAYFYSQLLALCLSLFSCSSDVISELETSKDYTTSAPYAIPLDNVLKQVDFFIMELDKQENTRSKERSISGIEKIGVNTRCDECAGGYYIVNYSDNGGFAIVSTDSRMLPIYAVSTEGNFSLNDTVGNPVLKNYLDVITSGIITDPGIIDPVQDVETFPGISELVTPLLSKAVRSWTQKTHNKYVRYKCDNSASTPVGCVVLSAVQIMSCLKWPESIVIYNEDGIMSEAYSFNWTGINNGDPSCDDQVARLMEILGRKEFYNVKYRLTGSSAYVSHTPDIFKKLNFPNADIILYEDFEEDYVISELKYRQKPVQIEALGYKYVIDENTGAEKYKYVDSHAFVIDGYCKRSLPLVSGNQENTYFHLVWGNGSNNGYYYLGDKYFKIQASFRYGDEKANDLPANYMPTNFVNGF